MKTGRKALLILMVLAVYVLHQDFWNWRRIEPLVFGFLPAGLAYHIGYSVVASVMMAILVRYAWPSHLEKTAEHREPRPPERERRQ